ncbi:MAG: mechanosensitive ion channel family protein [Nitrospirales bacterium]|nr:MAG: mechanosensitive ion channel family protein [Nitrospirales bacterium]
MITNDIIAAFDSVTPCSDRWIPNRYRQLGLFLLVMMLAALPWTAIAQETQAPSQDNQAEQVSPVMVPTFPVMLDGEVLFEVRGVSAYPAELRAKKVSGRIEAFAADLGRSIQSLRLVEESGFTTVYGGNQPLTSVVNADGRLEGGVERQLLAQVYLKRIAEAVKEHREQRKPKNLMFAIFYALAATGILASGWWGLRWTFNRLDAAIERRYKTRVKDFTVYKVLIFQADQMWAGFRGTLKAGRFLLVFLLLYAYFNFVFRLFPWTAYLGKQLFHIILDPLRVMGKGFIGAIPSLVFLVILVILLRYVLKFSKLIFYNLSLGRATFSGFDREWAWPTYRIFRTLLVIFGLVMAYPYIPGSSSDAFKGISIFLGVLLSLGSTSLIGNILAGYSLVYRRAFRIGDRVKINEHVGDVIERRLMVTHLRSLKNEEVIVPNSEIINGAVVNYSSLAKEQGLILHRTVGIGYETPWRQVEAMLMEAADRTPGLLKDPGPFVLQQGLGDCCVTYELNVYCDKPKEMMEFYSRLSQNILDVFNEHSVQIMTPAYERDPDQPKIVPKDQWYAPPAKPPEKSQEL